MVKVFLDFEFTGLHKGTTPISLGAVTETGKEFYGEFVDYSKKQIDSWIQDNVIDNLMYSNINPPFCEDLGDFRAVKGTQRFVTDKFSEWVNQFKKVELWVDCGHYDIVLIHGMFGHAFNMPDNVYYIPFDISTLMKAYGVDPDISREGFIDKPIERDKHSALYDAKVIQACYDKLMRNKEGYLGE